MTQLEPKDPQDVSDYLIDWSDLLDGDTIATSLWTVPTGITKDSDTNTTTSTKIWLSGGTGGVFYACVNKITTAGGRTLERTFIVPCREL